MPRPRFQIRSLLILMVAVALLTAPMKNMIKDWQDSRNKQPKSFIAHVGTLKARVIIQEDEDKVIGVFED